MFATSRQVGRIPVIAVLGAAGSGKTTFLNRLLRAPQLAHSVVLQAAGNRFALLDHVRQQRIPKLDAVSESGCLCCGMRGALGDALRNLFLGALSKRIAPIDRVIIEADISDPTTLKFTLRHAPFLGQRYVYQGTFLVLDVSILSREGIPAEGSGIEKADVVVFAKTDMVTDEVLNQARFAVKQLNPSVKVMFSSDKVEALLSNTLH